MDSSLLERAGKCPRGKADPGFRFRSGYALHARSAETALCGAGVVSQFEYGECFSILVTIVSSIPLKALLKSGLRADPIHAAIDAHARACAAYATQVKADAEDFDAMMLVVDAEHEAAAAVAATVPTTLAGAAAALAHVRMLYECDGHPMLDDWHCYVFIASAETALRRVLAATV